MLYCYVVLDFSKQDIITMCTRRQNPLQCAFTDCDDQFVVYPCTIKFKVCKGSSKYFYNILAHYYVL